ncbi:uncharacterized protein J7T54_002594 [Emericellopsis cladophorae]|uniref:Sulfotransferase domain-containing protein n=1 Tax=Emericellopsis cladophorae TaxID=2686198 RepID=A0A9Q0BAJ1_9HYPO|nr:uncharacterized protein J7T54_002594 [Emericellopsis cladophorae]KAI6778952.1 hypothetical protein J7T54_002594 [Emericellopsis cladophorae]
MTWTNGTKDDVGKVPVKTREVRNAHLDSTVWNDVKLRPDDIVISTFAKSGTTWTQQIVSQLLHQGDPTVAAGPLSPWVDFRIVPRAAMLDMVEAQTHRRFLKTHLPRDAMVWDPKVKYLFIARDGRDTIWSLHHHFRSATPAFYALFENVDDDGPAIQRPSENPRDLFIDLLEDDTGTTLAGPFWAHIRGWWEVRHQPNLLLVHFNDLKADLEGSMRRIAKFLEIPDMPEDRFQAAVEHCTFDWMKEHAEMAAPPLAEMAWENGAKGFINKGTNSRWKNVLSEEDNKRYQAKAREELGEECATWLQSGGINY